MASPASSRVGDVTFLEFRERAGLDRKRIPIEGTVETTYRCNLNCVHCYVNQPAGSSEERERELSLDRLKQLVDEIVAEGTLFVLFTGGEVLLRPDFPELYLYARGKGVPVTLKTMALAWNHHEIEAMEAYAKSLGLVFRFDSSLNPRVDCGANRNGELQLDPERALQLDLGNPERMEG